MPGTREPVACARTNALLVLAFAIGFCAARPWQGTPSEQQMGRQSAGVPAGVSYHPLARVTRENIQGAGGAGLDGAQPSGGAWPRAGSRQVLRGKEARRMSDYDLLALMRPYQPGRPVVRDSHPALWSRLTTHLQLAEADMPVRQTAADMDPAIQGDPNAVVRGSQSTMQVWYTTNFPPDARKAFEHSLSAWSENFASPLPVRFRCIWKKLDGATLGATATPVVVAGGHGASDKLASNTMYVPALAEAVQGRALIPANDAHVVMIFESTVNWNFDTTIAAPKDKVDFATTCLHEQCHGLWFSGQIDTRPSDRQSVLDADGGFPGRFDRFLADSSGNGTLASCPSPNSLYRSLANKDLRYLDPKTAGVSFSLYAPSSYVVGSSTYHLDGDNLMSDCAKAQISEADCSDLMTYSLEAGYTQRSIGENTRRMMLSQLGGSEGVSTTTCSGRSPNRSAAGTSAGKGPMVEPSSAGAPAPAASPVPVSNSAGLNSGPNASDRKGKFPIWAMGLSAGIAGVCIVALIGLLVFKLRSSSSSSS